jgi:ketosteroid isomerase-like protein
MADSRQEEPEAMVQRLVQATNAHDLDAMVDCFTVDYRNQTPAHPAQGFVGREQVRKNWEQIFRFVPDISVRVLGCRSDGDMVWSEWEMAGTRRDGSAHLMTGVILFGVREGQASWARFYLEPVEAAGVDVNGAVRQNVGAEATGAGRAEPEGRP